MKEYKCDMCNRQIEWYRGRPKKYCERCRIIATKIKGKKYYNRNKKERVGYGKQYYKDNREEMLEYEKKRFEDPILRDKRKAYMKKYNEIRKMS